MKIAKLIVGAATVYTVAEIITMWRLETRERPLKDFFKEYFGLTVTRQELTAFMDEASKPGQYRRTIRKVLRPNIHAK